MSMTDPISDMFTRIRNANAIKRESVDIPLSKMKLSVLKILREEGFIKEFKEVPNEGERSLVRVYLKYGPLKQQIINKIERVSKSSRRIYKKNGRNRQDLWRDRCCDLLYFKRCCR